MKKSRFTDEKIVEIVRESMAHGVPETARKYKVSEQSIYIWRKRYGGLEANQLAELKRLQQENNRLKQYGGGLYFVGLKSSVYEFAAKTCFVQRIGNANFFDSKTEAIRYIYPRLDKEICKTCQSLLFKECQ